MKKIDINELKQFISETSKDSRIYIGCDSFRHKKDGRWYASFTVVVIVHIDGRHGCRVFGDITTEPDYDQNKRKPAMRLMTEVYKAVDMFEQLKDIMGDREVELHLDINPNKKYGSSCVVDQAIGYVRGVAGIDPLVKPDGFAATHCADHFRNYGGRKPEDAMKVVA